MGKRQAADDVFDKASLCKIQNTSNVKYSHGKMRSEKSNNNNNM